jgi:hypothetical protein
MTTCPDCGKPLYEDSIHTCSPQKPPPSGVSHEDSLKSGEQARALALADELDKTLDFQNRAWDAAKELRRLHEELDATEKEANKLRGAVVLAVEALRRQGKEEAIAAIKERLK